LSSQIWVVCKAVVLDYEWLRYESKLCRHWLLFNALQVIISTYRDVRKLLAFQIVFDSLAEEDFFYHKLKEFMICMKQQVLKAFLPLISFLHAFDRTRNHNMLALMLDPCFKNMLLVVMYLGWENVDVLVIEHDDELLLPLLVEATKLLMHSSGAKFENFVTHVNYEDLFSPQ
jgi:hypothetical protein